MNLQLTKKLLDKLKPNNIFLYEVMTGFKHTSKVFSGYSVGETTLELAILLGANDIYLLGTDLALDSKGYSHGDGRTQQTKDTNIKENNTLNSNTISSNTMIKVKGNFQQFVTTTIKLNKSLMIYNQIIPQYMQNNPTLKIYNLSNGAYIQNTIPTQIQNIALQPLNNKPNLHNYLQQHSTLGFDTQDKANIKKVLKFIKKLKQSLNNLKKQQTTSYTQFVQQRIDIFNQIFQCDDIIRRFYLFEIFANYFTIIEPYLAYQFNDTKLKITNTQITEIKNIWIKHITDILDIMLLRIKIV